MNFNPRSREGSDLVHRIPDLYGNISIHAPAKGATQAWTSIQPALQFQSTLPRRERLPKIPLDTKYQGISIHAPAKGATVFPVSCKCCSGISIHAPAKGATELHWVPMQWLLYFNPRSREGSDITSVKAHTL